MAPGSESRLFNVGSLDCRVDMSVFHFPKELSEISTVYQTSHNLQQSQENPITVMLTPLSPSAYSLYSPVADRITQPCRARHGKESSTTQKNDVSQRKRKITSHDANGIKVPKKRRISETQRQHH